MPNYIQLEKEYNVEDFQEFIENENKKPGHENDRFELINGQIYMMSSPNEIHHDLSKFIERYLDEHFEKTGCKVYHAPFDLYLSDNDKKSTIKTKSNKRKCRNVTVPDLMVVCDKNKRKLDGIYGPPDLIFEIVSRSSIRIDYMEKLYSYLYSGVREYWVVDPLKSKVSIYNLDDDGRLLSYSYSFSDIIPSEIFTSFRIDFSKFKQERYEDEE
jgi:Uma2 family endonuclease